MRLKKSLINTTEFCKIMKIENISNKVIIKLYRLLRNIIKKSFHLMWNREPLALDPADQVYPCVEIDEISVIGNANTVICAFGIIDRSNKKALFFCIINARMKETFLSLIKKKVNTILLLNGNQEFTTKIFSDCFSSYRENDFNGMNYILHRVNHSVRFGAGLFHTNTVEGLWLCIKRISNGYS